MKKVNIEFNNIENAIIENEDVISLSLINDGKTLIINTSLNPKIIDSNFNELEDEILKLKKEINKLKGNNNE